MKHWVGLLLAASLSCCACSSGTKTAVAPGDSTRAATAPVAMLACGDSLPRMDGSRLEGAPCRADREYCYEASGGAAFSHGAHCRPLPKPGATCSDLVASLGAGTACTGTPDTGLRVAFTYP